MATDNLKSEFEYYLKNQEGLVKEYEDKFLVIKDKIVQGAYDSEIEAYTEGQKSFELGTFLIQHCLPGAESHTQTFYSRVGV